MDTPKNNKSNIPEKLGRYELREKIGAGGMGLIYKGFDTRLKRPVAIKMISDRIKDESVRKNVRERFFNEARAAGALSHPNLVQIYDCGELDDIVYIVMEYIEGETLEQLLKSKGPLSPSHLIKYCKEISDGLSFAHKKGIVHRDIKPSNIIIEANSGISKILDFGIAKFVDEEELKLTSTGMVLGSTHYLSPEHIIGKNLDGRSDIFCLGTVLYESATGMLPFRGTNSSTILYKIVHFDPPPASEIRKSIPSDISNLIKKCLSKKSTDRYQSCDDLLKASIEIERKLQNTSSTGVASPDEVQFQQQNYYVRDSQLLTTLVTQKKISADEAKNYRGPQAYERLVQDGLLTEDELAQTISELLQIPWIPKGRLKSIRIDGDAFELIPNHIQERYSVLPFFRDIDKKSLSLIIDGSTDFQTTVEISELFNQYHFQYYIGAKSVVQRLIQGKIRDLKRGPGQSGSVSSTGKVIDEDALVDKRILLIEPDQNYQSALVKLTQDNEQSLTIVSNIDDAFRKIRSEKFHHVWANQMIVGDELAFEGNILRHHPSCSIRVYENLSEEIFEDSVPYNRFRDFFIRLLQVFLSQGSKQARKEAQKFGSLAVKISRTLTQNPKELDEIYFSALIYKWERSVPSPRSLVEILDGAYRLRHIANCLTERFDGRGPRAIKGQSIPIGSRTLAVLSLFEKFSPNIKGELELEEMEKLKKILDSAAGKQLDPILCAQLVEALRPLGSEVQHTKVAIVDSDNDFSKQLLAHLKRIDADAVIYSDGQAALSGIKRDKPDLIISEIILSKLDGFSLAARVKADEMLKKIPFVFLSESERSEHSTKAIQLGAEDFILKSADPQFILAKLEKLLKNTAA